MCFILVFLRGLDKKLLLTPNHDPTPACNRVDGQLNAGSKGHQREFFILHAIRMERLNRELRAVKGEDGQIEAENVAHDAAGTKGDIEEWSAI